MTVTIGEALEMSMKYNLLRHAYTMVWLLEQGASMDEPQDTDKYGPTDHQAVNQKMQENPLQINPVKLYSQKLDDAFIFCLAYDADSAAGCMARETDYFINKVLEVPLGLFKTVSLHKTGEEIMLLEMLDRVASYPHLLGFYKEGWIY